MAVCSYYLRGACKYGDRCRNEHPVGATGSFGNQTWTASDNRAAVPYTVETITADVTPLKDKPMWPLSSYGPAKYELVVIGGLDESPEELRLKAVTALKAGTTDEYTKYEAQRTSAADQMYTNARNNVRQLYEQALKASTQDQGSAPGVSPSALSAPSAFGTSPMTSALGSTTASVFGKPAFGQSAFGQTGFGGSTGGTSTLGSQGSQGTSAFGASAQPVSAFGQPSQTTSVFGQATQATPSFGPSTQSSSVFGQPSAFGAAAKPTSAFAQPSTQPPSVFGKPSQPTSAFGQPSQPTSAFGQTSQPTSAFAQPSQPTSAFAQPSQPTSAFAQSSQPTSAFAQPSQPTSAFSQPSQPTSAFGQSSQPAFGQSSLIKPASGAFGGGGGGGFSAFASQPSTFTSVATSSGSPTDTTAGQTAFGTAPPVQSSFGAAASVPKSAFGPIQPPLFGTSSFGGTLTAPSMSSPASAMSGSSPFASSPMTVTPSSEKPAAGTPDFASAKLAVRIKPGADRYLALLPRDYSEMIPADVQAAFTNAKFEWGKIPNWIPPEEVR